MLSNVGKDIWKDNVAGYVVNGLVRIHSLKKSLEKGTYKRYL